MSANAPAPLRNLPIADVPRISHSQNRTASCKILGSANAELDGIWTAKALEGELDLPFDASYTSIPPSFATLDSLLVFSSLATLCPCLSRVEIERAAYTPRARLLAMDDSYDIVIVGAGMFPLS